MAEWFWMNEWYIETAMYYVVRLAMVTACVVYIVDTVRKWVRKRRNQK